MKQGDIWFIILDPTIGAEIRKTRPALIVNDDAIGRLPLRIVVPITGWKEQYRAAPWMVKIQPDGLNNLDKESAADCFQVRSISNKRFLNKIGEAGSIVLDEVRLALAAVLSINLQN